SKDATRLTEEQCARLRRLALDWLRADLKEYGRLLQKDKGRLLRPFIAGRIRQWLADSDFAGVRGPQALARLPETERQPWQRWWDDVADTVARTEGKKPQKKSDEK